MGYSLFMTSLCKSYWQTILAQGLGVGIGIGLLFLPSVSILSQYFFKRRSLAIGIAVTGSSIGGICLPIMLNNLIQSHGFERAVQYTGYLIMGTLILANFMMHPRLPPQPSHAAKPSPKEIFNNLPYSLLVAGLFATGLGLFFPIYYLQARYFTSSESSH
jgi:MFS family permease